MQCTAREACSTAAIIGIIQLWSGFKVSAHDHRLSFATSNCISKVESSVRHFHDLGTNVYSLGELIVHQPQHTLKLSLAWLLCLLHPYQDASSTSPACAHALPNSWKGNLLRQEGIIMVPLSTSWKWFVPCKRNRVECTPKAFQAEICRSDSCIKFASLPRTIDHSQLILFLEITFNSRAG